MSKAITRLRRSDDSGASLVLALIFITVGAVVLAAILSFADVSMRTTIILRSQAADSAGADGAAKIAVNALRQGTYSMAGGDCFASGNTLQLPNFYQPQTGGATSATVTCEPDGNHSVLDPGVIITPANRPGSAILTLAPLASSEDGVRLNVAGGRTLRVHGAVYSNSTINVALGTLESNTSVTARGACSGTINSTPARQCNIGTGADPRSVDPNYPPPTAPTTLRAVPTCPGNNSLVTFTPGRYTDLNALRDMTKSGGGGHCKDSIFYFPPGAYYFDFSSNNPWPIETGYLVAGTPTTPLVAGTAPSIPGSCQSPIPPNPLPPGGWVRPGPNAGVQFIFGGNSHIEVKQAQVEICGTYSTTSPPLAVYGLKTAVGPVPAQSGCVTQTPYPSTGCAMLKSDNSPNSRVYVQGTTYAPRAALDISLNNATGQVFRFGVIARTLLLSPTGSANLSGPVIEVPDDSTGTGMRSIVYLTVYLCPNSGSCSTSATVRLRAKVGIADPTGVPVPGTRHITVYSWSVLR